MAKIYANIQSQYYLLNSRTNPYNSTATAWKELKDYVYKTYTNSDNETVIIDEDKKHIKIITKNINLAMDRYVPIKDPVNIIDLDANVK